MQKYDLPFPEAVFDLGFYRRNPKPFCSLAQEMWPGVNHFPTLTHSFIALLAEKKLLLRDYTQNIDGLEYLANTPADLLVECHGHYRSATCIECGAKADPERVQQSIVQGGQAPICEKCKRGLVKPDIVFFGESLPFKFHAALSQDKNEADLLLVLGTSLQVAPVSAIPNMVRRTCKRALINRDLVGNFQEDGERDVFCPGDCDDSIRVLSKLLGWYQELEEKHEQAVLALRIKQKELRKSRKSSKGG